jgi:mannose-6-phosphate isomerase-like protein (cupin superfamily)
MNTQKVIFALERAYPGKKIIQNDKTNPTEIICEIQTHKEDPHQGLAVAVVDQILPHYHTHSTEVFEVIRGILVMKIGDEERELMPGQKVTIEPGVVHSAYGKETWVKRYSTPPLASNDIHVQI